MTREQARRLESLVDFGFLVLIKDHEFIDGPVKAIYPRDTDDIIEEGKDEEDVLVYDSDVFVDRPLLEVDIRFVSVYEPAMKEWPENTGSIHPDLLEVYKFHQMRQKVMNR